MSKEPQTEAATRTAADLRRELRQTIGDTLASIRRDDPDHLPAAIKQVKEKLKDIFPDREIRL